jgi:chromosome segregation ATPase
MPPESTLTALGLSWEEAAIATKAAKKQQDQRIFDFTDKRMAKEREEMELQTKQILEDAKAEKERLKSKLELLEATNIQLKSQLQSAEAKATEWQSLYRVHTERSEMDEKVRKANAIADSEALKTAGVVWKVAAGLVIAVAVPIIKHYIAVTSKKE